MNNFGVYSIQDLRNQGFERTDIERLVATGQIFRLSRGWYARPDAQHEIAEAVRHRARIGCVTGCGFYGVWVPPDHAVHVLAGSKRRPALPLNMRWHPWRGLQPAGPIFSLEECLEQVVHRHDVETALICLESATNRGLVSESCARDIIAQAPLKRAGGLSFFSPAAESGTETRVRLFLQRRGVSVQAQVQLDGVGRVDLIAGESWVIECDSRRYHTAEEQYEKDRQRDLVAMHDGRRTLRLTYAQVFDTWDNTQSMLSAILKTKQHRQLPRPAA